VILGSDGMGEGAELHVNAPSHDIPSLADVLKLGCLPSRSPSFRRISAYQSRLKRRRRSSDRANFPCCLLPGGLTMRRMSDSSSRRWAVADGKVNA